MNFNAEHSRCPLASGRPPVVSAIIKIKTCTVIKLSQHTAPIPPIRTQKYLKQVLSEIDQLPRNSLQLRHSNIKKIRLYLCYQRSKT